MASATRFGVVITDISLGGGVRDGVWLMQRLQRTAPPMPVVAMTGHKERYDELMRLGFAAVLIKPIDALNLAAIVQACCAADRLVTRAFTNPPRAMHFFGERRTTVLALPSYLLGHSRQ